MGIFQRIKNGMIRFMYGRNGMDQLNRALFWIYIGIFLAQTVFSGNRMEESDTQGPDM